jgi:hypothetical protein
MKSYQQQYLAIHANLIAELCELERLRERVKNAELLPLRNRGGRSSNEKTGPPRPGKIIKSCIGLGHTV